MSPPCRSSICPYCAWLTDRASDPIASGKEPPRRPRSSRPPEAPRGLAALAPSRCGFSRRPRSAHCSGVRAGRVPGECGASTALGALSRRDCRSRRRLGFVFLCRSSRGGAGSAQSGDAGRWSSPATRAAVVAAAGDCAGKAGGVGRRPPVMCPAAALVIRRAPGLQPLAAGCTVNPGAESPFPIRS